LALGDGRLPARRRPALHPAPLAPGARGMEADAAALPPLPRLNHHACAFGFVSVSYGSAFDRINRRVARSSISSPIELQNAILRCSFTQSMVASTIRKAPTP